MARSSQCRRAVATLMLVVVGAGAGGIPVFPLVRKDRSTPFFCQDRACGCGDAAACWRGCCCATDQQKLAWARKQGVTPPEFVTRSTPDVAPACEPDAPTPGCCRLDRPSSVPPAAIPADHVAASRDERLAIVLASSQSRCQGLGPLVFLLSWALPCTPPVTWSPAICVSWLCPAIDPTAVSFKLAPPSPPPRLHRCV